MTTIKFENHSGIKVFVKFDSDDVTEIIFTNNFRHYIYDLGCTWAVVGDDGLTYVERLEQKYGKR